ncbi:DUF2730 family protein [Oceanibaculum indicum]|uniref:DUF2730 family protein n=1 Tax=Oceanibaculum indicum P24 TaxID=1207063 RepID=K2JSI6_9PROT|nr:DUF2730 family protein [Oceanibaculum indicum]EKE78443.1 hypothetical protein P24_02746 [Oceanibaculum indicum P24]
MTILDQIRENWPLILAAANVGFGWLMWRFSRVFASKKSVEELATAHGKSAEAIQMLQSEQRVIAERLNNLPSVRDVADLRENTAALAEASKHLSKSIETLSRRVELLTENELEGARK